MNKKFEVIGGEFRNKGSYLMLKALSKRAGKWTENLAIRPSAGSFKQRGKEGYLQRFTTARPNRFSRILGDLIPKKLREKFGLVVDSDIAGIIDISGFAYSDQWGARRIDQAIGVFKSINERGGKIILLPQAFGSFNKVEVADAFKRLMKFPDLIFVRDSISEKHVKLLIGEDSRVMRSPDFTMTLKPDNEAQEFAKQYRGSIGVVVNARMIDKIESDRGDYLECIISLIRQLLEEGKQVLLVNHENVDDAKLIEDIVGVVGESPLLELISESPMRSKAIFEVCEWVVGSRYHALVSSLSMGTPVVALGWSHKYGELLNDFNVPELMSQTFSVDLIQEIMNFDHGIICEKLNLSLKVQQEKIEKMWSNVERVLNVLED